MVKIVNTPEGRVVGLTFPENQNKKPRKKQEQEKEQGHDTSKERNDDIW